MKLRTSFWIKGSLFWMMPVTRPLSRQLEAPVENIEGRHRLMNVKPEWK